MTRRKKIYGKCHICGLHSKLSFEHVPPQSAFNDHPIFSADIKNLIGNWNGEIRSIKGKIHQLGSGDYTLCERCNANTGAWYGNAFADWAYQAFRVLRYTRGAPSLHYQFRVFPLRVLKQIVCMFFSANGEKFCDLHPDLVKFVLNREARYLKPEIRIYAYYNLSGVSRQSGISGLLDLNRGSIHTFSEIAFFPLGYLMTIESQVPDDRLIDISFFARYRFNDWKEFSFQLPVLPVYTYFPGDYRNRSQVLYDRKKQLLESEGGDET
jgi:hypothetical protein